MKRVWTKSWRRASTVLTAGIMVALGMASAFAQQAATTQRHNELTLAGLRPGTDRISAPKSVFRTLTLTPSRSGVIVWRNRCGERLRVETDEQSTVQTVTASTLGDKSEDCKTQRSGQTNEALETGRRLELNNVCGRVTELYGAPESRSPSVEGSRKLELLFYSFDWAGEDVPQSMEVSCDAATGRVVEITLASSTL